MLTSRHIAGMRDEFQKIAVVREGLRDIASGATALGQQHWHNMKGAVTGAPANNRLVHVGALLPIAAVGAGGYVLGKHRRKST